MEFQRVFIAGAGTMGLGIAQVAAQAGLRVILFDVSSQILENAVRSISWSVGKLVEKGVVAGPLEEVMKRIMTTTSYEDARQADIAVEAVFEDMEVKRDVLEHIGAHLPAKALVASNTSALPITDLASFLPNPQRVLGLHFFNPVPMLAAVEVVKGALTSRETLEAGREFVLKIGKEPIMVMRDTPGFVINRINLPSSAEAMRVVEEGIATAEDVDKGVKLALGRRMGIFETGDLVGLDVTLGALTAMYEQTREPRWYPPLILRRKVKAGQLGRKTGKGWYFYDDNGRRLGPVDD